MNNKITIGLAIVALLLGGMAFFRPAVVERTIEQVVDRGDGSLAGTDSGNECQSFNGVTRCFYRQPMRQASSTVCSFRSPTQGTSTLSTGVAKFITGSSSAMTVYLARGATPNATSSSVGFYTLAAGAQGTFVASSTDSAAEDGGAGNDILDHNTVFGPGQFFNVNVQSGVHGADTVGTGFVPVGSCNATFEII